MDGTPSEKASFTMLFSILSGGDPKSIIVSLLLMLPMMMLALSAHEAAHGWMAYKCGDNTAYLMGRLTLNPVKHLDPIGFLAMLVFGYGWANPVPVNSRRFRNPRRGMALTAAAGPVANLIIGIICSILFGILLPVYSHMDFTSNNVFLMNCVKWLVIMFQYGAWINFVFMTFNLIPLPPFDGSRIVFVFLPPKYYFGIMKYERQIMFGVLIALLAFSRLGGFSPFSWVAKQLTNLIARPVIDLFSRLLFPAFN